MKTFKWNQFAREARREPYVLDDLPDWHPASDASTPAGPGSITIPVPDGEKFMAAEHAQGIGQSLELLCGEQWPAVKLLISGGPVGDDGARPGAPLPSTALVEFMQDITRHFSIGDADRPPAAGRR